MTKHLKYLLPLLCVLSIGFTRDYIFPHASAMGFFSSYDSKSDLKAKRRALREQIKQDQTFNTQIKNYKKQNEIRSFKHQQSNSNSYRRSMASSNSLGGNYGGSNLNEALRLNQSESVYTFESDKRLNTLSSWFGDEAKVNREKAEMRAQRETEHLQYEKYSSDKANSYNKNSPKNNNKSDEITDVIDKLLQHN